MAVLVGLAALAVPMATLDVVVVWRVDVVGVRPVIVRMVGPVGRGRLVLVRARAIAHAGTILAASPRGTARHERPGGSDAPGPGFI